MSDFAPRQVEAPLVFRREGMNTLIVDADVVAPLHWRDYERTDLDAKLDAIRAA